MRDKLTPCTGREANEVLTSECFADFIPNSFSIIAWIIHMLPIDKNIKRQIWKAKMLKPLLTYNSVPI